MPFSPEAPTVGVSVLRVLPLRGLLLVCLCSEKSVPRCRASSRHRTATSRALQAQCNPPKCPFPSLRAASLSVAALNMDDTTFSMSSNVIIFMINLSPSLSGSPRKTLPVALNAAQSDPLVHGRLPYFIPHIVPFGYPSSSIPSNTVHRPPSTVLRPPRPLNMGL
jgi:hypothetical protein